MSSELVALNQLIDDVMEKEQELDKQGSELALQSKEFAQFLEQQKRHQDELQVLWSSVKEFMEENNITEHETDFIKLKLSPLGKYKATVDIEEVPDELCDIKKTLSNKKVKSYLELNGELPENVVSQGNRLMRALK